MKNENKTGFVFVRVKIVMHGLTATQEFCKLSNVRIYSFVRLTSRRVNGIFGDELSQNSRCIPRTSTHKAIAVVFCTGSIFSNKSTSPL
jgi:hypothetical protein